MKQPQLCRMRRAGARSDGEKIELGDEERGASAGNCWNAGAMAIIATLSLEHVDKSIATTDIDALPLGIKEYVVGIAACRQRGDTGSALHRKQCEPSRAAEDRDHLPASLVQCHG